MERQVAQNWCTIEHLHKTMFEKFCKNQLNSFAKRLCTLTYIHTHSHSHTYIYTYTYTHTHPHTNTQTHIHAYTYVHIYMHTHGHNIINSHPSFLIFNSEVCIIFESANLFWNGKKHYWRAFCAEKTSGKNKRHKENPSNLLWKQNAK